MKLPVLRAALASILFLSACAALQNGMSSLTGALTSVASLSSSIGQFTSSLEGLPGQDQLKQIAGFSDQAGELATVLADSAGNVPTSAADGVAKVQGLLGDLGNESFSLDSLQSLAPAGLTAKVSELSELGTGLGTAANGVLGMLGQ